MVTSLNITRTVREKNSEKINEFLKEVELLVLFDLCEEETLTELRKGGFNDLILQSSQKSPQEICDLIAARIKAEQDENRLNLSFK